MFHKQAIGEGDFTEEVLNGVERLGQPLAVLPFEDHSQYRGYWIGITLDPESGVLKGGAPHRFSGLALGE